MKIVRVLGFESTEFEREMKKCKVIGIFEKANGWIHVLYKRPYSRKEHKIWLQEGDVQ